MPLMVLKNARLKNLGQHNNKGLYLRQHNRKGLHRVSITENNITKYQYGNITKD